MKLSQVLIGAILIGITIQTVGCDRDDTTKPDKDSKKKKAVYNCPACGMG